MAKDVTSRDNEKVTTLSQTEVEALISAAIPIPIGAVVWWMKGVTGVPALSPFFVECNGQVLNDVLSPLHGQTMPNINNAPVSMPQLGGKGLFIRGGTTANLTPVEDQVQGHYHQLRYDEFKADEDIVGGTNVAAIPTAQSVTNPNMIRDEISNGSHGAPRTGSETRPAHLTLVAIVRVR